MTTLTEYKTILEDLVPGEHNLTEAQLGRIREKSVEHAIQRHSKWSPRDVVEDFPGDDGFAYALSGLTYWNDNFSNILSVEYPVDDTDETPEILDPSEWKVYERPAGKYLYFVSKKPKSTEEIRIKYTAYHTVSAGVDSTIEVHHEEAFQSLCACLYCRNLSAAYSLDQDSTIEADAVQHATRAQQYRDMAIDFCNDYKLFMGINENTPAGAVGIKDLDLQYPPGYGRLTHPGKWR